MFCVENNHICNPTEFLPLFSRFAQAIMLFIWSKTNKNLKLAKNFALPFLKNLFFTN